MEKVVDERDKLVEEYDKAVGEGNISTDAAQRLDPLRCHRLRRRLRRLSRCATGPATSSSVLPGCRADLRCGAAGGVRPSGLVRAVGTGHSFSRVADTSGTLVSTLELDLPLEVLGDDRLVVVPGGATYARLTAALHEAGWAVHNLGSLPHISVAGACSTGTHGSGNTNGQPLDRRGSREPGPGGWGAGPLLGR